MRLSSFISQNKESILSQWEDFARTIEPPALTMDAEALRNHASYMLDVIIDDLQMPQTPLQQSEKSMGRGPQSSQETYAETHASARLESGYTITQLVSEYRALRASVLKLWATNAKAGLVTDPDDVTRFNEAIDQALSESVGRFSDMTLERAGTERHRLNAVLHAAPVGITLADHGGRFILTNPENSRIWGDYPVTETTDAQRHWKGWWADGSDKHGQPVQPHEWAQVRALAGEESPRDIIEIEPFGSPGVRRTILFHGTPVRDAISKVIGSVVAQMDITGLVKAEAALRESETKFRTITNAMPQMVWSTLPDGFHDYYNQQWYDFIGEPNGSTNGSGWNDVFHPEDQLRAREEWQHCLATGEAYEIQYRLRHHSGEYRWTLGRALPIHDDNGKIIRWMGTCTDIHAQKVAEEKLKDADARKDEFLAMLAHELRNPLAPISTAARILNTARVDETMVRRTSEIISRQVKHMTSLVDDLLDVSRVTRGLIDLEKMPVDVHRIVAEAVEQVNPLIQFRRHHLMLHVPPETAMVMGDNKRLVQVLANILANAAKYTHDGGNILLKTQVEADSISLSVEDDGIGMASDLLERVFDLFSQAERTSDRSSGGLGLGLALVKSLVELHGGTVSCASKGPGLGSQFKVCLPRLMTPNQRVERRSQGREAFTANAPLKILIVDDNVDAAQMLSMYLTASGHNVLIEHRSLRALETARIEMPDVYLLDIGIPEMDGNELAQHLRAHPKTAKAILIAVTGYGQEHDRQNSFASGFDHHMVKPVDMAKLSAVLAMVGSD
ncbi:MAG TPA: ATP-binding protein [Noviherbaspirillum sp.]|jgi:PAS domain S-box-containing protein|uniref:hybrid sensor histidine kinase/response regulator n=1 Tax=Noviherbaspirillum sp. TaxID=1926288 RepID=UPI002DDCDAC2|nr:ATP-binding protein [Noviherbaspirillum sp.]HEV2610015.1 ATP-binding protein [Noviherbaspirillum sp.]